MFLIHIIIMETNSYSELIFQQRALRLPFTVVSTDVRQRDPRCSWLFMSPSLRQGQ